MSGRALTLGEPEGGNLSIVHIRVACGFLKRLWEVMATVASGNPGRHEEDLPDSLMRVRQTKDSCKETSPSQAT